LPNILKGLRLVNGKKRIRNPISAQNVKALFRSMQAFVLTAGISNWFFISVATAQRTLHQMQNSARAAANRLKSSLSPKPVPNANLTT
jgi:spore coat polysaccharide biosynthesis predicted glycosyltransferase SpsG